MSSLRYDSLNSNICNLYCLFLTLCILYVSSTHAPNICCPILNDFYLPLTKDFKSHFCNHHTMGLNLDICQSDIALEDWDQHLYVANEVVNI